MINLKWVILLNLNLTEHLDNVTDNVPDVDYIIVVF
jgi:hypothetical protein